MNSMRLAFLAALAGSLASGNAMHAAADVLDCAFVHGDRATENARFEFESGDLLRYCERIILEPLRCVGPDYQIVQEDDISLKAVLMDPSGGAIATKVFFYDKKNGAVQWTRSIAGTFNESPDRGTCLRHEPQGLRMPR